MNIWIELFGYVGTALVVASMMMTSVKRLRILNICGSVIGGVYAFLGGAWPIVTLNVCLTVINLLQLIRQARHREVLSHVRLSAQDASFRYFLSFYGKDIDKYFPEYTLTESENTEIHTAWIGSEAVGILAGERRGDVFVVGLDYATPKYRGLAVGKFLFSRLKEEGVSVLDASAETREHRVYLCKMGFEEHGIGWLKRL